MYKLLNYGDFLSLKEAEKEMEYYSSRYHFDGYELIQFTEQDYTSLEEKIIGYHLRFFPSWMEFYKEDFFSLAQEYEEKKYWKSMCGGEHSKEELLDYYRRELAIAEKLKVKYVVFHACNIKVRESVSYQFSYTDWEVLDQVISIINTLFDEKEYSFQLLFENLWWPGLKLNNKEKTKYLWDGIHYNRKGFILDTGHMINCNWEIKNKKEAVEYIKKNLEILGEYKNYIYGMHLNLSLSGEYVREAIRTHRNKNYSTEEIMKGIYQHIGNIDYHDAFDEESIVEVIQSLPLRYFVYEFIAYSKEELEAKIQRQDKSLKKLFVQRKYLERKIGKILIPRSIKFWQKYMLSMGI